MSSKYMYYFKILLYILFIITLLVTPIYPDEQVFQLISFRGIYDGNNYNNLSYICSTYLNEIPVYLKPIRILLYYLFGAYSSPISFRIIGLIVFSALIYIFRKYLYVNNSSLLTVFVIGYIPFSLFMLRPEGVSLLLIGILIIINNIEIKIKFKNTIVLFIFSTLLILHPRNIFLLPLIVIIILKDNLNTNTNTNTNTSINTNRLSAYFFIVLSIFISLDVAFLYNKSFHCPEYDGIESIYKSLKPFDLSKTSFSNIKEIIINQILSFPTIFKYLTITTIHGVDLLPAPFEKKITYIFFEGFVKLNFVFITIIVIYENLKLKSDNYPKKFEGLALLVFLISCLIFQKVDRFYEAAIFFPILIYLFNNILLSRKGSYQFILVNLDIIKYIAIFTIIITMLPKFINGYGPYNRVLPKEDKTQIIIDSLMLSDKNTNYLVVDFETFHYFKNTYRPILMNFFWWYTDEIFKDNKHVNRLQLLNQIDSDGIFINCDRMPKDLLIYSYIIPTSEKNFCYISKKIIQDSSK